MANQQSAQSILYIRGRCGRRPHGEKMDMAVTARCWAYGRSRQSVGQHSDRCFGPPHPPIHATGHQFFSVMKYSALEMPPECDFTAILSRPCVASIFNRRHLWGPLYFVRGQQNTGRFIICRWHSILLIMSGQSVSLYVSQSHMSNVLRCKTAVLVSSD